MELELQKPEIDFDSIKSRVENFLVENSNQYLLASNELLALKRHRNAVVSFFAEMKSSAHATWKAIVTREKHFTDQIDTFETLIKKKMLAFQNEQDRIRREREAELQREANAKAEAERKRLLANARANEKRGNEMNAQMYRDAVAQCAAPVIAIASTVPKAAGVSTREVWKVEIVNKKQFIKAIADSDELLKFVTIKDPETGEVVIRMSDILRAGWREMPGVRFYKENILSVRS